METSLPPPTTAPRSSDQRPDASQFSHSREVRDLASLISWSKVGLTPAPAPTLSAHLTARVSLSSSRPGPFAPLSLPPPRAFHVEGSSRDCLPGSLSGSESGWRFLFPSSSLPARLAVCEMSRRTRPVSAPVPMPGVCFLGVLWASGPERQRVKDWICRPFQSREVKILRPLPISTAPVRG